MSPFCLALLYSVLIDCMTALFNIDIIILPLRELSLITVTIAEVYPLIGLQSKIWKCLLNSGSFTGIMLT